MGNRGPQPGTGGRPRKPLADKVLEGGVNKSRLTTVQLPQPAELKGTEMPPPHEFLGSTQKSGLELAAKNVYETTWAWLQKYHCEHLVTQQNLEQYAMTASRWIQCEEAISQYGFLAKHPTTGAAIASPYVSMAREYSKHANALWNQIYAVVRDNCSMDYSGSNPQDDVMERLLTMRRR